MSYVYLTRHIASSKLRIIKRISKMHPFYGQLRREASMLAAIKHPYIPELIQAYEDGTYFYLVEEYIDGESLRAFSTEHDVTPQTAIYFGMKMCLLIGMLHEKNPKSILYLDFKPDHFLIEGSDLKLIDLGSAQYEGTGNAEYMAVTPGFHAPELSKGVRPDKRADVYGICAVLYYLLLGKTAEEDLKNLPGYTWIPRELRRILARNLSEKKEKRDPDVAHLFQQLQRLKGTMKKGTQKIQKIAVVSALHGAGATHMAMSLTTHLNAHGVNGIYLPVSQPELPELLNETGMKKVNGIYRYLQFTAAREEGQIQEAKVQTLVYDIGTDYEAHSQLLQSADLVLMIAGVRSYEAMQTQKMFRRCSMEKTITVLNATSMKRARAFCLKNHVCAAVYPRCEDPFQETEQTEQFFEAVLSGMSDC